MEGLAWDTIQIPFAAGLDQGTDDRARKPPFLDVCIDARFDEIGNLQTRYPLIGYAAGALSNMRRAVANSDELVVFTDNGLYAVDDSNVAYQRQDDYLAIAMDEASRFVTTDEQRDCDRAELDNVTVYTWAVTAGASSDIYAAAMDATTGTIICPPTKIAGADRPRLVALSSKILLFYVVAATGVLRFLVLDTTNIAAGLAAGPTAITALGAGLATAMYDVAWVTGTDTAVFAGRLSPTTSYVVGKVTAAAAVSSVGKARSCDGPIAVSVEPTGASVQVIRPNGVNIQGDLITIATLVDTAHVNKAVGTTAAAPHQIAAAHRSVQDGGQYRCYAFWDDGGESTGSTNWQSKYNYVDTGGGLGAEATFVRHQGIASRAFNHAGRVFVWTAFAGVGSFGGSGATIFGAQVQNTFLLYRDDATFHAKAAPGRAGGFVSTAGHLSNVEVDGSGAHAWCGVERRRIPLGGTGSTGYADRAPRDIVATFDSDEARRCVRMGETLYIAGGLGVAQYDGRQVTETGFAVYPWDFALSAPAGANLQTGSYAYKTTWRWNNAKGEVERSTTVNIGVLVVAAGPKGGVVSNQPPLHTTRKISPAPSVEVWRTLINPTADAPFYLVTSPNPADAGLAANEYIVNDPTLNLLAALGDAYTDADLASKESNSENGGILENLAPPACKVIAANDVRVFIGGVAGDPHRVWYSKQRREGEIVAFHDALVIDIPPAGGDITALAFLNTETLVVFRETAIYAVGGDGYDNAGGGQNYGPARLIASDLGATNAEAVALTPAGLMFKTLKGWYLLGSGWQLQFIGGGVSDYDEEEVTSAIVVEGSHELRITTTDRALVYDYNVGQWGERSIDLSPLGAFIWRGVYGIVDAGGVRLESTAVFPDPNTVIGLDIETAWIKMNDLQGRGRVRAIEILGEWITAFQLHIQIAYDYAQGFVDDIRWTPNPAAPGPLQVKIGPSRQQFQAIKLRIATEKLGDNSQKPPGLACKLTGLAFEVGVKPGLNKRLPVAQRT